METIPNLEFGIESFSCAKSRRTILLVHIIWSLVEAPENIVMLSTFFNRSHLVTNLLGHLMSSGHLLRRLILIWLLVEVPNVIWSLVLAPDITLL